MLMLLAVTTNYAVANVYSLLLFVQFIVHLRFCSHELRTEDAHVAGQCSAGQLFSDVLSGELVGQ